MNRLKSFSMGIMLVFITTFLTSCEAIGSIFKAGMWTGVIVVVGIVGLIIYLISRSRK